MIRIYPTLIDSFRLYLNTDFISFDEIIDRINRVERKIPDIALRGIALNDVVDNLVAGELLPLSKTKSKSGKTIDVYTGEKEGKSFLFPAKLVDTMVLKLLGSEIQTFSKAIFDKSIKPVELYGYSDYVLRDTVIDLKCKRQYRWPAYQHNFQHKCYLYTLRASGIDVNRAEYLITELVDIYTEDYFWNERMVEDMTSDINSFLRFIEEHKDKITDEKILGTYVHKTVEK